MEPSFYLLNRHQHDNNADTSTAATNEHILRSNPFDSEINDSVANRSFEQEEYLTECDDAADVEDELSRNAFAYEEAYNDALITEEINQQESVNFEADETNRDSDKVFIFAGVFCRKLYCSQQRPREFEKRSIEGNDMTEVLELLWQVAKKQVHRAVTFKDDIPTWAEDDPKLEHIQKFVTLQDACKKKLYYVSSVSPRLLRNWRQTTKIFVYVYSTNVENNTQYQQILKKLILPQNPDRSGANSTVDESVLAAELRSKHPDIEGHHSSWLLWANLINSSPIHERDKLKTSKAPPLELAKYFRWTAISEAARLQSLHRGIVVASSI
ncbi:uncharacterized protein LOC128735823 [Sabethes cyaneus]|uniref:uncharacterized protein LOC128735823 n=1 Tax=Sabethes cyaneus TaxID=53552 RepID=UPI00237E098B|nr:uncharacterized protein LOC128735823 [Sabethes cyaneus]